MKTVLVLSPTTLAGISAGIAAWAGKGTYSLFLDMQSNVVELQERRYLIEHQIPGREGGILQDLGSACARVTLSGKWIYENKPDKDIIDILPVLTGMNVSWNWLRMQMMRYISRLRAPLFIASDVITSAVMIEDIKFRHVGGRPNVFDYTIKLREWNPALTVLGIAGIATNLVPAALGGEEVGR